MGHDPSTQLQVCQKKCLVLLPNLGAQVSWHSQEEGRKPARLWEGPRSHGNKANYNYLLAQSHPEQCLALAKGHVLPLV